MDLLNDLKLTIQQDLATLAIPFQPSATVEEILILRYTHMRKTITPRRYTVRKSAEFQAALATCAPVEQAAMAAIETKFQNGDDVNGHLSKASVNPTRADGLLYDWDVYHLHVSNTKQNPVTGCSKVSAGCAHCYAERMTIRLKAMGVANYRNGFRPTVHEHTLTLPLSWKRSQAVFVNSMSDLFHRAVPLSFILKVFTVMAQANWHRFQILTKRSERLLELNDRLPWAPNIWMGVTVEHPDHLVRIDDLRQTDAAVKFLSLEPLLAPMPRMNLRGIDWVIVGGESGPGARPMLEPWVTAIRDQCQKAGVPFYFKQWGGVFKKRTGRLLQGRTHDQVPAPPSTRHQAPAQPLHVQPFYGISTR